MNDLDDALLTQVQAARLVCGDGPGALGNFYQWRHRYPVLDRMSLGAGKSRRWRRADLLQFLVDLPRHRAALRGQAA